MKTCFVISPIGDEGSETRRRSDLVLKFVITPVAEQCGYKATRADQISEPGQITIQVIDRIVADQLVIADLTDRNPNVFYELAIRHATQKPFIQIIKKGEQIPFDVFGMRTTYLDIQDPQSIEDAKEEIIQTIKNLENNPKNIKTPISVAINLQNLMQSDKPVERSLGDIVSLVSEIKSGITMLEREITNPAHLERQIIRFDELVSSINNFYILQRDMFLKMDSLLNLIEERLPNKVVEGKLEQSKKPVTTIQRFHKKTGRAGYRGPKKSEVAQETDK
jgi:hypothetical protein